MKGVIILFGLTFKDIKKCFTVLDEVKLEDLYPLRSDQELTAWKFSFDDNVLWLPVSNLLEVTDFAAAYKLLLNAELYNVYNDYEVYGDEVGLVNKALGITNEKIVKTDDEKNTCINVNLATIKPKHFDDEAIEKKNHIGIFFNDCVEPLREDNMYNEIVIVVKGSITEIAAYLFRVQMELISKTRRVLCNKVYQCNNLALIKFKVFRKEE